MVSFSTGAEGLRHTPGDIFEICDNDYAGASVGGRITAADAATRSLTLDRDIELPGTGSAVMSFIGHDGNSLSASVISQPGKNRVILNSLPEGVAEGSVWGLKLPALRRRLFRCTAIQEKEDGTYAVSALQHVPEKEAVVDRGAAYEPESGTLNSVIPPAVQHLTVDTSADSSLYLAKAEWDTPRVIKGVRFLLRLTTGAGTEEDPVRLVTTATTGETQYAFRELPPGDYTLTVRAINGYGQQGDPASVAFSIQAPEAPATIELTPGYFQITVTPHQTACDASVQYEFWYSDTQLAAAADIRSKAQYLGVGPFWIKGNINPGHDAWFYVRSVNRVGKSTFAEAKGQSSNDAEGLLQVLGGKITATELGKELLETIESGGGANAQIEEVSKSWTDAEGKLNAMRMTKIGVLQDGRYYIAGIGAGIENTPDGMQSQILLAAQQTAIVDPTNGNTIPMFVARDGQVFMNEAFINKAWLSSVVVTDKMQSENYVPGKQGFILDAKANKFEFFDGTTANGTGMAAGGVKVYSNNREVVILGDISGY